MSKNRPIDDALLQAVERGDNIYSIRSLVSEGANVNAKNKDGNTALILAIYKGHDETVEFLIKAKTNLYMGLTHSPVLTIAVLCSKYYPVSLLIEAGADPRIIDPSLGESVMTILKDKNELFFIAAKHGHKITVRILIENGIDCNSTDKDGTTALMLSAAYKHFDLSKFLIDIGADVNLADTTGNTALMYSFDSSSIKYLLENGANPNAKNKQGRAAIDIIIERDKPNRALAQKFSRYNETIAKTLKSAFKDEKSSKKSLKTKVENSLKKIPNHHHKAALKPFYLTHLGITTGDIPLLEFLQEKDLLDLSSIKQGKRATDLIGQNDNSLFNIVFCSLLPRNISPEESKIRDIIEGEGDLRKLLKHPKGQKILQAEIDDVQEVTKIPKVISKMIAEYIIPDKKIETVKSPSHSPKAEKKGELGTKDKTHNKG